MRKTYKTYEERSSYTGTLKQTNILMLLNELYPFRSIKKIDDVLSDIHFKKIKFMIMDYMNSKELESELIALGTDSHDIKKIMGLSSEYLCSMAYLYVKSMLNNEPLTIKVRTRHKIKADIKSGRCNRYIARTYKVSEQYVSQVRIAYEFGVFDDVLSAVQRRENIHTITDTYCVSSDFVYKVMCAHDIKNDIVNGVDNKTIKKRYGVSMEFIRLVNSKL